MLAKGKVHLKESGSSPKRGTGKVSHSSKAVQQPERAEHKLHLKSNKGDPRGRARLTPPGLAEPALSSLSRGMCCTVFPKSAVEDG